MDLSKFDLAADQGETLELRAPNGDVMFQSDGKTPVTLKLLSADSATMVAARNLSLNMAAKRAGRNTAEAVQADNIRLFAKATVSWSGVGLGEDDTPFSFDNAVKLYTQFPFIREQVDAFITERSNFMKG